MKTFLNPKTLIPAVAGFLLVGLVLYIFLAPPSWPKPIHIRFEGDEAQAATPANGQVEPAPAQGTPAGAVMPPVAVAQGPQMLAFMQGQAGLGIMYELDRKVVNLSDPGGLRYLQTSIVLEFWPLIDNYQNLTDEERLVAEDEFKVKIDAWNPIINDIVMTQLSSKSYVDIATIDGKKILKEELMAAINDMIGYEGVVNIYFTDFIIQ